MSAEPLPTASSTSSSTPVPSGASEGFVFASVLREVRMVAVTQSKKLREQADQINAQAQQLAEARQTIQQQLAQLQDQADKLDKSTQFGKTAQAQCDAHAQKLQELLQKHQLLADHAGSLEEQVRSLQSQMPSAEDLHELEITGKALAAARAAIQRPDAQHAGAAASPGADAGESKAA